MQMRSIFSGLRLLIKMFPVLVAQEIIAAPNLQAVSNIDGVTIIADHENPRAFYYLKSSQHLATRENRPDFRYSVNRYIGKKVTGDEDVFWVRGVIKFSTESHFSQTNLSEIGKTLETRLGQPVTLAAAPIKDSFKKLVYATIDTKDNLDFSGELSAGLESQEVLDSADDIRQRLFGSRKQRFTIGLSGNDANLFWENFERDNLSLSLGYGWTIPGVVKNENDEWIASEYQVNNSLPIRVSIQQYPQLFSKNELWQRVSFAHSGLKIMCYDFINLEHSDLYYVNVEVRFNTLRDQQYTKEVKFRAGTETYEQDISFELANDIKGGYQYRVRRLTNDGEMTRSEWINDAAAWLDVSLSAAALTELEKNQDEELEL